MISVIIPVFNGEKFIGRCLDSLMRQTFNDFDVTIINDGSTDDTVRECLKYKSENYFPMSVSLYSQQNLGVGAARNHGLLAVNERRAKKRRYVFFLDADDYLLDDAFEKLARTDFGWQYFDMIVGGIFRQTPEGKAYRNDYPTGKLFDTNVLDKKRIAECVWRYIETNDCYLVSHCWGRLYNREFIKRHDIKFNNMKVGEDGSFNIKALTFAEKVMVVNEPIYCFQQHGGSSAVNAVNKGDYDLKCLRNDLLYYFWHNVDLFIGGVDKELKEYAQRERAETKLVTLRREDL